MHRKRKGYFSYKIGSILRIFRHICFNFLNLRAACVGVESSGVHWLSYHITTSFPGFLNKQQDYPVQSYTCGTFWLFPIVIVFDFEVTPFGLRYQARCPDPDKRIIKWAELDRPLRKQLEKFACKNRQVQLGVLFHTRNPVTLEDEVTR